jgi:hypothetical protein
LSRDLTDATDVVRAISSAIGFAGTATGPGRAERPPQLTEHSRAQ